MSAAFCLAGVTHEFFGMAAVVKDAARAQDMAAKRLRESLAEPSTGTSGRRGTDKR